MDNLSLQVDEIEALSSIYENEFYVVDETSRVYKISICDTTKFKIDLQVVLPPTYPSYTAPKYELHAPWLKSHNRSTLQDKLDKVYQENVGQSVLFMWVEAIREFVQEKLDSVAAVQDAHERLSPKMIEEDETVIREPAPAIKHGEPFTDRRSTFQAHLACVTTPQQVAAVRQELLQNRKISNATHNIMAYRIFNDANSSYHQDCDDDGETAAGGRMLHLLEILDVKDVVVIVSRWYGGILLGPDRFKHINNVTRNILVQEGFIDEQAKKSGRKHK
ncbi:unnamed protein product [Clavelina lepadiformis]|uniref:RWD domain-containing protein n=1 Tax=Clavelina lepadiformis TaxID=159417 RepID=A0ABP0FQH0_CLALP